MTGDKKKTPGGTQAAGAERARRAAARKDATDTVQQALVHGQLLADAIDELGETGGAGLFRHAVKHHAKRFVEELEGAVGRLWGNMPEGREVAALYDLDYGILRQIAALGVEGKHELAARLPGVIAGIREAHMEEAACPTGKSV